MDRALPHEIIEIRRREIESKLKYIKRLYYAALNEAKLFSKAYNTIIEIEE